MVGKPFTGVQSGMSRGGLIDIDFKPLPIIVAGQFGALSAKIKSLKAPLQEAVKTVVIPSIRKNFDVGGRPAWTELAEGTIQNRAREGYGPTPILQRSRKGRNAATAMARWVFTKEEAYMGANFPPSAAYMPIHQIADTEDVFTGASGTAYLPGRPFAVIQTQDSTAIERVFAKWFTRKAAEVGLPAI